MTSTAAAKTKPKATKAKATQSKSKDKTTAAKAKKTTAPKKAAATSSKSKAATKDTKGSHGNAGNKNASNNKNALGFRPGSDSAIIAAELVEGGESRAEISARAAQRIEKENGLTTRNGTEKSVTARTTGIVYQMLDAGYTIKQSYSLVPPPEVKTALSAEKRKKAAAARKKK